MDNQFATQEQIDQLAKALASAPLEPMGSERFCEMWPSLEQGLSALQGILAVVPGVNVFAGPAIGIVRAAGAATAQAACRKP